MTTALQTDHVHALRPRARILVLAAGDDGLRELADALKAQGHVVTCLDAPTASQVGEPADLALVHAGCAEALPEPPAPVAVVVRMGGDGQAPADPRYHGAFPGLPAADAVRALAATAVELRRWRQRCDSLEQDLEGIRDGSALVGCSPQMRRLATVIRRAADSDATVLIEGQPGTGKSLVARSIHGRGRRGDKALIVLPSATVDETALASALEQARGATLLLEDIEQLPAASQGLLVRHLKERSGKTDSASLPRLLVTTSARLPELVAQGGFREDLFYRLHVFPMVVPALRERREDIPLLVRHFAERYAHESGHAGGFTAPAMILLESLPWPGNVAQLENVVRRAMGLADQGPVDRTHLLGPATGLSAPARESTAEEDPDEEIPESSIRPIQEEEQRLLSRALRATKGNVRRAAQLLGIGRATLYRKIQQYKLRMN